MIVLRHCRPCSWQGDIRIETEALLLNQVVPLKSVVIWLAGIVFAWQNGVDVLTIM